MGSAAQSYTFAVCNEPYCVWDRDLRESNSSFVEGLDADYFQYVASTHYPHIEDKAAQHAAMAIRANYHLALETLFSLIGATLQASRCAPAWILKAKTHHIRAIAEALFRDSLAFPIEWKFPDACIGFDQVSSLLLSATTWAKDPADQTVSRFANLMYRLASDFLDEYAIQEYNSIKHGFRARSGGFTMAVGFEHEYGVPPPPEEMHHLGGSKFGTSFFAAEPIEGAPKHGSDPHFGLRRKSVNWLADATAARLVLTAMLIQNIRGFLLVCAGKPAGTVQFFRPDNPDRFDEPWSKAPGVLSSSLDRRVMEQNIYRVSKDELRNRLVRASPKTE